LAYLAVVFQTEHSQINFIFDWDGHIGVLIRKP